MSHELMQDDQMVYAGEVPWHGLGAEIPGGTKVKEGFAIAGLDWPVGKFPVFAEVGGGLLKAPDNFAIVRRDTNKVLGVVGSQFTPVQNVDAFEAIDKVVGTGVANLVTAGSLKGGRLVWALLELPGEIQVRGNDRVKKYVTMINGHDGHTLHMTFCTPTRIVCWNTMQMALGRAELMTTTKHTRNVVARINNIAEKLGHALKFFSVYEEKVKYLASIPVKSQQEVDKFLLRLKFERDMEKASAEKMQKHIESAEAQEIRRLYETGKGNTDPSVKHTFWTLLNGVTEYVDHFREPGGKKRFGLDRQDARLSSAWLGTGAELKNRALDLALAMAAGKEG